MVKVIIDETINTKLVSLTIDPNTTNLMDKLII